VLGKRSQSIPAPVLTLHGMADDSVLEEAMDNLREAGQRIRATQHLLRAHGMTEAEDYRELSTRLSTSLAMVEASYLQQ
jgi:alpha-beta hydrolase superfamily lysophospholipase